MSDALFDLAPEIPTAIAETFTVRVGSARELNPLLITQHYLGPLSSVGFVLVAEAPSGEIVAGQAWRTPTARHLPNDGSWLELSRWVLTPQAGRWAGTRFHSRAIKLIRRLSSTATTLVSYSDPSAGHTGALYRAGGWAWCPAWHRLRPPPTGGGAWADEEQQAVKDRWVYPLRPDERREQVLAIRDPGAIRAWSSTAPEHERRWAARSLAPDLRGAA